MLFGQIWNSAELEYNEKTPFIECRPYQNEPVDVFIARIKHATKRLNRTDSYDGSVFTCEFVEK